MNTRNRKALVLERFHHRLDVLAGLAMDALESGHVAAAHDMARELGCTEETARHYQRAIQREMDRRRRVKPTSWAVGRPRTLRLKEHLGPQEQRLLDCLCAAGGDAVPYSQLCEAVGVLGHERQVVYTLVYSLRKKGAVIDAVPRIGYAVGMAA